MSVKLRFAPSPTGKLHVGNLRTALFNVLLSKKLSGQFILRLDDTDQERSTEAFAQGIAQDLAWLGLHPQQVVKQSDRFDRYREVIAQLIAMGRLYPAYETPEHLERKRKRLLAKGKPPVYDRAALELTDAQKQELEAAGHKPHYRFLLDQKNITFTDLIRGEVKIDAASLSDPVLVRADGSFLYTLCSVIDDIDMGISHIVRGEDHVTNTGVQVQIFETLGAKAPIFAHHPLLTDAGGEKLSKRLGSLSAEGLREAGLEPMTILSYLARLGTSAPIVPCTSIDELVQGFDMGTISSAPARFSPTDLQHLNARVLAAMSWQQVQPRLAAPWTQEHWLAIRNNIDVIKNIDTWYDVFFGHIASPYSPLLEGWQAQPDGVLSELAIKEHPAPSEHPSKRGEFDAIARRDTDISAFLQQAAAHLPSDPWNHDTWSQWTKLVTQHTGRKGKSLFMPLRLALTGKEHGPEMAAVLPLLGRTLVLQRLQGHVPEIGGYENKPEPTRFGDWEKKGGIISDF